MTLNQKVNHTLKGKIIIDGETLPIDFLFYKGDKKSYMTFYSPYETPDFFAGDETLDSTLSVTITLFSDKNYINAFERIKELMTEADFIWTGDSPDMFDDETGIYQKASDFEIERSLLNG